MKTALLFNHLQNTNIYVITTILLEDSEKEKHSQNSTNEADLKTTF